MTNLWQRLKGSLRNLGPRSTFIKLWVWASDVLFDRRHGLDTCRSSSLDTLTIESGNKASGHEYQPTRVVPLRRLFKHIQPLIPPESVLVDLGCGKGRVLFVASEFGFKGARGLEFARELCEVARKNCDFYKASTRTTVAFEIIETDVTTYRFRPDENIFFMFNPFDDPILSMVLDNISASLKEHPRKILVLYYNPRGALMIEQRKEFQKLQILNFWGYSFVVYGNRG